EFVETVVMVLSASTFCPKLRCFLLMLAQMLLRGAWIRLWRRPIRPGCEQRALAWLPPPQCLGVADCPPRRGINWLRWGKRRQDGQRLVAPILVPARAWRLVATVWLRTGWYLT